MPMEAVQITLYWVWGILVQLCVPAMVWAVVIAGLIRIVKDKEMADRPVVWDNGKDEITKEPLYEPTAGAQICCRPRPTNTVIIEYVPKGC